MKFTTIGVIDSGAGGKYLEQQLNILFPSITTIRYAPLIFETYSNISTERLCVLCKLHMDYIYSKGKPDIIIVACMTLSSNCLEFLKSLSKPNTLVLDLITCLPFLTNNTTIFATPKTINSGRFNYCIEVPCSILSSDIEKGGLITHNLMQYTERLNIACTSTILLGCSHYSIIKKEFQETFKPRRIIDPVDLIISKLKGLCEEF